VLGVVCVCFVYVLIFVECVSGCVVCLSGCVQACGMHLGLCASDRVRGRGCGASVMLPGLAPPCAWLMTTVASLSSLPVSFSLLHCCPQYSVWEPQKTAPVLQVTSFSVFPKTGSKHGSGWEDPAIRAGGAGDFSAREKSSP
jgi:hypothetical protein